jgi:RNA polymerase sigma factor (TIGR02999 family)
MSPRDAHGNGVHTRHPGPARSSKLAGMSSESAISQSLQRAETGDEHAAATLLPLVYQQLRQLASTRLAREPAGSTLQPTALVHEAYLRLEREAPLGWRGRAHFFASAAEAMRRILVEQARRPLRRKRAAAPAEPEIAAPDERVLDVDWALQRLAARDERQAQLVKLRYFAGLSNAETAAVLGVSIGTAERDWRLARAMLQRELATLRG